MWWRGSQCVEGGGHAPFSLRRSATKSGVYRVFDRGRSKFRARHLEYFLIDVDEMLCHEPSIYSRPSWIYGQELHILDADGTAFLDADGTGLVIGGDVHAGSSGLVSC